MGVGRPLGEPGEGVPGEGEEGCEAPEAEPPEREDRAADEGVDAATSRADQPGGGTAGGAGVASGLRSEEEPVPGPSGLGQTKGIAAQREAPCSPAPHGEGDVCMEPKPRGPMTKGAQRRALLAEALLRRGASFCHLRPLSLPWRGSKGAAPVGGDGEVAQEREEEPAVQGEAGGAPVAEEMDEDVSEGEALPPEDKEMNTLRGDAGRMGMSGLDWSE